MKVDGAVVIVPPTPLLVQDIPVPGARRLAQAALDHNWEVQVTKSEAELPDLMRIETVAIRMRKPGIPRWTAVWRRDGGGKWAFDCAVSSAFGKLGARDIVKHIKGEL